MSAALAEIEPVEVQPDDGPELLGIPFYAAEQAYPMAEHPPSNLDELDAS